MRLENFLSGWRVHLDTPAADVVELRTFSRQARSD
jgi:hypothetical protein